MSAHNQVRELGLAAAEEAGDAYATFAREEAQDRRAMRFAVVGALVVHLVIFVVHLPEVAAAVRAPEPQKKIYVVQQVRFEPPPTTTPQQPQIQKHRMPIPDPTPDEPEPLRIEEPTPEVDLAAVDDVWIDIPDAPPTVEPEEQQGPIEVGGAVTKPVKIYAPQPRYSEIARKARIEGLVVVRAIIDRRGNVVDVQVIKDLPMGLTEEAVAVFRQWKFAPATLGGKPVDVYYNLTVSFHLQ